MKIKQNFIEDNIIIVSKQTIDEMLKQDNPSHLISLYVFYYYTAKWQKTNIIKCSTSYVVKGLKWNKEKTIKTKKDLIRIGLIQNIIKKDKQGKITGWYIKVNYIWKKENVKNIKNQCMAEPEGGLDQGVENPDTNALSANNLNALNADKELATPSVAERKDQVIFDLIEKFKAVNPTYERLFGNTTQRGALERLVKKFGKEQIGKMIDYLPKIFGKPYAPVITTPYLLEQKFANYINYVQKEKGRGSKVIKI